VVPKILDQQDRQAKFDRPGLMSGLALHNHAKTNLEQEAKAGLLVGSPVCLVGLLCHLLHVVVMMMVVMMAVMVVMMAVMITMMVMMTMMLCHRGRIRARRTDHGRRESQRNCKPEGREEGLLHGIVSFCFAGSYDSGR